VYGVLGFCALAVGWVIVGGNPVNGLHTAALTNLTQLAAMTLMAYIAAPVADDFLQRGKANG
jgi:hypothetical protein